MARAPGSPVLLLAAFVAGVLFWSATSLILRVAEPWDSPEYWLAYLLVLGLAALFGSFAGRAAWLRGILLVFAQLPVMLFESAAGPLIGAGIAFLAILSAPAAAVAMLAARLTAAHRRANGHP